VEHLILLRNFAFFADFFNQALLTLVAITYTGASTIQDLVAL
jgi:hypothetical protein